MSTFTKDDLKTGHLVVLRDGQEVVIFKDCASGYAQDFDDCWVTLKGYISWSTLKAYNKDLTATSYKGIDIMEVYLQSHPYAFVREYEKDKRVLLWKREEKSEKDLQIEELQVTITQAQEQINKLKGIK